MLTTLCGSPFDLQLSKVKLDRLERLFIWLQTTECASLVQLPVCSVEILTVIQLTAEILPCLYGQKDEETELFYYSTKAPYHWDYSCHYNSKGCAVQNLEAYKKSVQTNHL